MNANARPIGQETDNLNARLAVLIDADNAQAKFIEGILAEVARFGEATVKRIYGDFTSPHSAAWKKVLQQHAIKPVQQFAYTTGKNATDSALIIDAMDLLYTRKFDGFCLVTSDSDFTGLATRLREEGLRVLGFGEQKTPDAFRNACHKFVFTEVLGGLTTSGTPGQTSASQVTAIPVAIASSSASPAITPKKRATAKKATKGTTKATPQATPQAPPTAKPKQPVPKEFLLDALQQASDDSGWAGLGGFGSYLNKLRPDFDSRVYGYKKLTDLVKSKTDLFIVEEREVPGQSQKRVYLRAK